MKIGYARVSTEDQKLDLQLAALTAAGCTRIFSDHAWSGSVMQRPGLVGAIAASQQGGTLVVWRLDRLGRSLSGLVQLVDVLGNRGIEFQSLTEAINTGTSGGKLVFHIMAALAEFERTLISERTKAGLAEARKRGNRLGRPPLLDQEQIHEAWQDIVHNREEIGAVAARLGVSERTLRRYTRNFTPQGAVPTLGQ